MPSISNEPKQPGGVLADDHSELDTLLRDLLTALDEGDRLKAFERLDLLWARLAVHIRAEHLCLFPSILDAKFNVRSGGPEYEEAKSAIDQLRLDHNFFMHELGTAIKTMRNHDIASEHELISEQLRDVRRLVAMIQARLERHNRLEENHVYRWVEVLLTDAERSALSACIRHELDNIPPRFSV